MKRYNGINMIIIDDILISDEIVQEAFICDLNSCKGGCCVDGDAGAPLQKDELKQIKKAAKVVFDELSEEAQNEIKLNGSYTSDSFFGYVTPTIGNGICVYGYYDENKVVKCAIERAYNEGRIDFKKPISCHLFPIREVKTNENIMLNYEPRETLCAAACKLGKKENIKVFTFLKEPIVRRFGQAFYDALSHIAKQF